MYSSLKLELVRLMSFLLAYLLYLTRRQRVFVKVVSISETAVSGWTHVSFETKLEAPGLDFKINKLQLVPTSDIHRDGLISWSVIVARDIMYQKSFPANPTFIRVFGKTYSLVKTPTVID